MKKRLWILFLGAFLLLMSVIVKTYALFESNAEGVTDNEIGKWNIKLNDILISDESSKTVSVSGFVYEANEHTEAGVIAPGVSGYFDLILDATDTDVAIKYSIMFNLESIENENISLDIITETDGNIVDNGDNVYSGTFSLSDIETNPVTSLRILITWDDIPEYDETDTELGIDALSKLTIPITIRVEQDTTE